MEFNVEKTAELFEINGTTGKVGNLFFGEPETEKIIFSLTIKNITDKNLYDTKAIVTVSDMYDEAAITTEEFTVSSVNSGATFAKDIDLSMINRYGTFLITVKLTNGEDEMNDFFKVARIARAEQQNDIIGVNGHLADHFDGGDEEKIMLQTLDLIKAAGFKWVADDFVWELCEREKGKIIIPEFYDRYVNACLERGLKIQMNLKLTNRLYGENHSENLEYLEALGRFYKTLAHKFKGKIGSWEGEGEIDYRYGYTYAEYPNNDFTPEQFATVMKVVYKSIKSEDPETIVTYGSLLRNSYAWLQRYLSAGGGAYSDAIAIHPYTYPHSPYGDVSKWLESCVIISKKHNSKSNMIRISELGWSTADFNDESLYCSEIEQASYSMQAYIVCKQNENVKYMSYYDITNDGPGYDNIEWKFGLLDFRDGRVYRTPFMAKPVYGIMPTIANKLTGIEFVEELYFDIWLVGLKFKTADGKDMLVLWSKAGRDKHIEIKTDGLNGEILWFDMFGNEHTVDEGVESFGFDLSICPIFIVADSMTDEWCNQPQLSLHRTEHVVKSTHHRPI